MARAVFKSQTPNLTATSVLDPNTAAETSLLDPMSMPEQNNRTELTEPPEAEELLGALEALGGSAGNLKLRELLGWDETQYDTVKTGLLASGHLVSGRGYGGTVSIGDGTAG